MLEHFGGDADRMLNVFGENAQDIVLHIFRHLPEPCSEIFGLSEAGQPQVPVSLYCEMQGQGRIRIQCVEAGALSPAAGAFNEPLRSRKRKLEPVVILDRVIEQH